MKILHHSTSTGDLASGAEAKTMLNWPTTDDIVTVDPAQVKQILAEPTTDRSGQVMFNDSFLLNCK